MTIPPGLISELTLLTQALDLPDTDVAETLSRLTADAGTAVDSYLGLSVAIMATTGEFDLTVLAEGATTGQIRTSLLVPLSAPVDPMCVDASPEASIALILYASTPGAFIDLAADLAWLTDRPLTDFHVDEHLTPPAGHTDPTRLQAMSTINQALGVLIGRGATLEQAERRLGARAASAGIDLLAAATLILAGLGQPRP